MTQGKTTYHVIGCMSGTSLDGLDIACCYFYKDKDSWTFEIVHAETFAYSASIKASLEHATTLSGVELIALDHQLGKLIGETVADFSKKSGFKADFIASHGHTVFHQPSKGFTLQIGNIHDIHVASNLPVIADFRSLDIALGGQGAPLVPVGDHILFHEYDYCLNLGGIANISFEENKERIAFDVCPVNMALNFLATKEGKQYDDDGKMAAAGKSNPELLHTLNTLPFYSASGPKSLGKEDFDSYYLPLLKQVNSFDALSTFVDHITFQIAQTLPYKGKMLVTGGGAHNTYLIDQLKKEVNDREVEVVLPADKIINFKEAMLFAFLGVLNIEGLPNCLASVTGATRNNVGGISIGL